MMSAIECCERKLSDLFTNNDFDMKQRQPQTIDAQQSLNNVRGNGLRG